MEKINVMVTEPLRDELLQRIAGVSPQIKLINASELTGAEKQGDFSRRGELDALLAETEVLYVGFRFPQNALARGPRLKWIQTISSGIDRYCKDDVIRQSPVILTNANGMNAKPISEFVFHLMLMFAKDARSCVDLQREKRWVRKPDNVAVLNSKTVGIVGLGNIGREVARLAKAFQMRVLATRRSVKKVSKARNVDVLFPVGQLPQLLSESDFVVIALPYTRETKSLIGERELRRMKPIAYLINVARGGIVDEDALIRALEEKWIAGAGFDVFATEPLSPQSRLWNFDNAILSPHISSLGQADYEGLVTDLFCENLRRYLNGKRLLNVVNKELGY